MKMASPEGTLVNMSPPTNSTPVNIQIRTYEPFKKNHNPCMNMEIENNHFSTFTLHIYRHPNFLRKPEILGFHPMDEIKQFSQQYLKSSIRVPRQARTKDCVHNLCALLCDILQVMQTPHESSVQSEETT